MDGNCNKLTTVEGKNINFRMVEENDAEFILSLRTDPALNKNISAVENDVVKQRNWIRSRKNSQEWYFIIENKVNKPVGTIRIYDVIEDSFCWGSWIILPEERMSSSFESAVLLYEYAFFTLGFSQSHFDVRKNNKSVINFHLKMGSVITKEDHENFHFTFKKEDYISRRKDHFALIDKIARRACFKTGSNS